MVNNTPLTATVRNNGTSTLTKVNISFGLDAAAPSSNLFNINLAPGSDTTLNLGVINASAGTHVVTIYTSAPNNAADNFTNNDTIQSLFTSITRVFPLLLRKNFPGTRFPLQTGRFGIHREILPGQKVLLPDLLLQAPLLFKILITMEAANSTTSLHRQ